MCHVVEIDSFLQLESRGENMSHHRIHVINGYTGHSVTGSVNWLTDLNHLPMPSTTRLRGSDSIIHMPEVLMTVALSIIYSSTEFIHSWSTCGLGANVHPRIEPGCLL